MVATALSFSSCDNDSREDEMFAGLNSLEKRIEVMETLQDQITAIQQLLEAADRNHITSIEDITDADGRTGFKINFKDSDPITIYNGVNGVNGINGTSAPTISVKKDTDGKFYWTLNGEFIEVEGVKVLAEGSNGNNGVTPKLKIEGNTWKVSYDGGNKWETVEGAVSGGTGGSSNITYKEAESGTYYIFTINGNTVNIPKYIPLTVAFSYNGKQGTSFEAGSASGGDTYEIGYKIEGLAAGQTSVVEVIGKNGYTAVVNAAQGQIEIKAPTTWVAGSVLIFISDGDQRTIMRSVNFYKSDSGAGTQIVVEEGEKNKTVEHDATEVSFSYSTDIKDENLAVAISYTKGGKDWLTRQTASTRALAAKTLSFTLTENTGQEGRTATVTISDQINTNIKETFTITQKGKPAPSDAIEFTSGELADALTNFSGTTLKLKGTLSGEYVENNLTGDWNTLSEKCKTGIVELDLSEVGNEGIIEKAFASCKSLKKVVLSEKVKIIGNSAFSWCTSLNTINLPNSLTEIGNFAFDECSNLVWNELVIPSGVTKIGKVAFRKCKLSGKKLIVKGATEIGDRAFASNGNYGANDVSGISFSEVILESAQKIDFVGSPFGNDGTKLPLLKVPASLVDTYKADVYFNGRFTSIEAMPAAE